MYDIDYENDQGLSIKNCLFKCNYILKDGNFSLNV